MHKVTHKLKELGWRRIAFSLVVLAYLGFLGYINVMMFVPGNWMSAMGHFDFIYTGDTHNLIHELVFALIVGTAAVGLASQLWKPKEQFAGELVALIAWAAMIATAVITNNWVPQPLYLIFGGLTLIATILHPAGRGLFKWVGATKMNKVLLTLVIIAAIPLTAFAFTNLKLQIAGGGGTGFLHGGAPSTQESSQRQPSNGTSDAGHQIPSFLKRFSHGEADQKTPADVEAVKQQYGSYTATKAEREGYKLDPFCLDAESFGQAAERGAMGYHATNEALLRGPIVAERPQALMFDAEGRVLGVEYEIMADAVSEPPQLFGQTFTKLPPHPGVAHEHYALHVWFIDNPNGQFADFNPEIGCPSGSKPSMNSTGMTIGEAGHNDQEHSSAGHYRNMAALSFVIILVGLLASFRPPGWRIATWITGGLPVLLGLASAILPNAESSLGVVWGFAAIVWGVIFVATADLTQRRNISEVETA